MSRKILTAMALVGVLAFGWMYPARASAQHRGGGGGVHVVRGPVFVGGYFYDPFFGPYPWWGAAAFPYGYYPIYDDRAEVRLSVTPNEAAVYVDGYYAGSVDDFDGMLQSLPLSPGGHDISVYLEGYRTVHQHMYLTPRKSYRVRYTMQQLASGETSEVPPIAPPVPPPPPGSAFIPRPPAGGAQLPPPPQLSMSVGFGTLMLRVQPSDAEVLIDGERWNTSSPGERLTVQLTAGTHHIEVRMSGYTSFNTDITVQQRESMPLNVSLSRP